MRLPNQGTQTNCTPLSRFRQLGILLFVIDKKITWLDNRFCEKNNKNKKKGVIFLKWFNEYRAIAADRSKSSRFSESMMWITRLCKGTSLLCKIDHDVDCRSSLSFALTAISTPSCKNVFFVFFFLFFIFFFFSLSVCLSTLCLSLSFSVSVCLSV